MEYFDAHAHYDDSRFEEDQEQVLKQVHDFGVTNLISAGYSVEGSQNAINIANSHPFVYCTAGISPNDVTINFKKDLEKIEQMINENIQ